MKVYIVLGEELVSDCYDDGNFGTNYNVYPIYLGVYSTKEKAEARASLWEEKKNREEGEPGVTYTTKVLSDTVDYDKTSDVSLII